MWIILPMVLVMLVPCVLSGQSLYFLSIMIHAELLPALIHSWCTSYSLFKTGNSFWMLSVYLSTIFSSSVNVVGKYFFVFYSFHFVFFFMLCIYVYASIMRLLWLLMLVKLLVHRMDIKPQLDYIQFIHIEMHKL